MGELSLFLKTNKKKKQNGFFPATKSLCDKDGEPLKWEIKPLSTKESEALREECMKQKVVPGRNGEFRMELDTKKYIARMMCECIVYPDLNSKELQDSYGVKRPEDLLMEMVDNPDEYTTFAAYVQEYNGFEDLVDLKEEAKN